MSVVEVGMSEIIHHLQENGEMKKAVNALVATKAGADAATVTIVNDLAGGELSDETLEKVAGGAGMANMANLSRPGSQFKVNLQRQPGIPGHGPIAADTSW
jgi:hypothetical protein